MFGGESGTGTPSPSPSRSNVLAREGIRPSTASHQAVPGSAFGRATGSLAERQRRRNDQTRMSTGAQPFRRKIGTPRGMGAPPKRRGSGRRPASAGSVEGSSSSSSSSAAGTGGRAADVTEESWVPLGKGWVQTSTRGSGEVHRAGLHIVVSAPMSGQTGGRGGQEQGGTAGGNSTAAAITASAVDLINMAHPSVPFLCLHEPERYPSLAAVGAAADGAYSYQLEVAIKCARAPQASPVPHQRFFLMFGYKSPADFYFVCGDAATRIWTLARVQPGAPATAPVVLQEVTDEGLKPNMFVNLLLQIRSSGGVSLDANDSAVFTAVRPRDTSSPAGFADFSGAIGVMGCMSKCMIKDWSLSGGLIALEHPSAASAAPRRSTGGFVPSFQKAAAAASAAGNAAAGNAGGGGGGGGSSGGGGKPTSLADLMATRRGSGSGSGSAAMGAAAAPPAATTPTASTIPNRATRSASASDTPAGLSEPVHALDGRPLIRRYVPPTDLRDIADTIEREIIDRDLGVTFDDIAALDTAKKILNEAVVLPMLVPRLFTGIREPWQGVLLFGPPGTGKTMLAKAVAGINHCTFFNVSVSLLVSKRRGEGEKIVRCLFDMARFYAPSIIFLDEVDAVASTRGADSEHEASRRLKTELFTQMDGIQNSMHQFAQRQGQAPGRTAPPPPDAATAGAGAGGGGGDGESDPYAAAGGGDSATDSGAGKYVMVLTTTNCPWALDEAMRRRLEKRIFIPLPDASSRLEMVRKNLAGAQIADDVMSGSGKQALAAGTEGFSGADIHVLCREACMIPMRKLLRGKSPQQLQQLRDAGLLQSPVISMSDFEQALRNTRATVTAEALHQYAAWDHAYGSH